VIVGVFLVIVYCVGAWLDEYFRVSLVVAVTTATAGGASGTGRFRADGTNRSPGSLKGAHDVRFAVARAKGRRRLPLRTEAFGTSTAEVEPMIATDAGPGPG